MKLAFLVSNFLNLSLINQVLSADNFYPKKNISKHINMSASFEISSRAIHSWKRIMNQSYRLKDKTF
jgi:hypothetical protein